MSDAATSGCADKSLAALHTARGALAGAVGNDGSLYALGGKPSSNSSTALATAERFGNGSWQVLSSMPTPERSSGPPPCRMERLSPQAASPGRA